MSILSLDIKQNIIKQIVSILKQEIKELEERIRETREAAIQAPGRMVARYDSSKEELSYLYDGLVKSLLEKQQVLSEILRIKLHKKDKVEVGSLFATEKEKYFIVLPGDAGREIKYSLPSGRSIVVSVITMNAPILRNALLLKREIERNEEALLEVGDIIVWPNNIEEEIVEII